MSKKGDKLPKKLYR